MSWKTDLIALGGLAVGGYFIFVNRDKIMAWLGSQVFGPAAQAYDNSGKAAGSALGGAIGGEGGAIVGGAVGAANQFVTGSPIVGGISGAIGGAYCALFPDMCAPTEPLVSNAAGSILAPPAAAPTQQQVIDAIWNPIINPFGSAATISSPAAPTAKPTEIINPPHPYVTDIYTWTSPMRSGRAPGEPDTVTFGSINTARGQSTLGISATFYTGSNTLHYEDHPLNYYVNGVLGGSVTPGGTVNLLPGQTITIK